LQLMPQVPGMTAGKWSRSGMGGKTVLPLRSVFPDATGPIPRQNGQDNKEFAGAGSLYSIADQAFANQSREFCPTCLAKPMVVRHSDDAGESNERCPVPNR
jgi:hypothetical protein